VRALCVQVVKAVAKGEFEFGDHVKVSADAQHFVRYRMSLSVSVSVSVSRLSVSLSLTLRARTHTCARTHCRSLIVLDPQKRYTIDMALEHPWITNNAAAGKAHAESLVLEHRRMAVTFMHTHTHTHTHTPRTLHTHTHTHTHMRALARTNARAPNGFKGANLRHLHIAVCVRAVRLLTGELFCRQDKPSWRCSIDEHSL